MENTQENTTKKDLKKAKLSLFKNKFKTDAKHPDFQGRGWVGENPAEFAAWLPDSAEKPLNIIINFFELKNEN